MLRRTLAMALAGVLLHLFVLAETLSAARKMYIEDVAFVFLAFAVWLACVVFGIVEAKKKNRSPHWMWFGLHPFGAVIVFLVMKCAKPLRVCPKCFKKVAVSGQFCPYCRSSFVPDSVLQTQGPQSIVAEPGLQPGVGPPKP